MNTITAYVCKQCDHVMYPHHLRCLNCSGREFTEITPSGKARLITYTVINELPWGIDERGRVLGIAEFENGVKAMGLVKAESVKIGMKLTAGWEVVRIIGGENVYGLIFR
ncbi:MAG: hypothetical protein U9R58_10990 [Chloroflexota bacterium]|nr:hypothetical protein [Chloroflexota bacterium]